MNDYPENDYNRETDGGVYFYTPRFYALDNFSAFSVTVWGKVFPTSEHAYQWKKFIDTSPAIAQEILEATNPNQAKKIADAHKDSVPASFHNDKVDVMEEILRAKLQQHEKVQKTLRETGSKNIFENSPTDEFWGVGPDGNGNNALGKLWMKLRENLVQDNKV